MSEEQKEKPKLRGVWFAWVRNRARECWPQIINSDEAAMPADIDIARKIQLPDKGPYLLSECIANYPCPEGEINGQEQRKT